MRILWDTPSDFIFPNYKLLDGGFLKGPQIEGSAELIRFIGGTILSFWDRSVDERQGSNSAFIVQDHESFAEQTFEAMKTLFSATFPEVYNRFKFEITRRNP